MLYRYSLLLLLNIGLLHLPWELHPPQCPQVDESSSVVIAPLAHPPGPLFPQRPHPAPAASSGATVSKRITREKEVAVSVGIPPRHVAWLNNVSRWVKMKSQLLRVNAAPGRHVPPQEVRLFSPTSVSASVRPAKREAPLSSAAAGALWGGEGSGQSPSDVGRWEHILGPAAIWNQAVELNYQIRRGKRREKNQGGGPRSIFREGESSDLSPGERSRGAGGVRRRKTRREEGT